MCYTDNDIDSNDSELDDESDCPSDEDDNFPKGWFPTLQDLFNKLKS